MNQIKLLKEKILEISANNSEKYTKLYMEFIELFRDYFKEQALQYIASLNNYSELKKFSLLEEEDEKMKKNIANLLEKIYTLGLLEATQDINSDLLKYGYDEIDMIISNEKAKEYAENQAGVLIAGINETTQKQISEIITEGIKNSATIQTLTLDIQAKFTSYSLYRSTLIAQQEVAMAYSSANRYQNDTSTQKLGVVGWKRAVTQKDSNVRESHKINEEEGWIPKNQPYSGTGSDIAPYGFNCRCHDEYSLVNPDTGLLYDNDEVSFWGGYTDEQIAKFHKNFGEVEDYNFKLGDKEKVFISDKKLTDQEVLTLKNYTENGFEFYNQFYKKGELTEDYESSIKFMLGGLNKLDNFTGTTYKGIKSRNKKTIKQILSLKKGDIYKTDSFFSTSKSKSKSKEFSDDNNILFRIISEKGKDLESISTKKTEKEVLFTPKSLFKVENIKKEGIFTIIEVTDL